jgi:hypothetical protein
MLHSAWTGAMLVVVVATLVLGFNLAAEPHFVDESAYFSQSYYARIFAEGLRDDVQWLEFPAYDLPPLPKYMIGAALWLADYPAPGPHQASAWYADTSRRFETIGSLTAARVPFVAVGVLGCVAIYGLGVMLGGRFVGFLAAFLLMENPLYHTHSRRAMSDAPCEAFMLVALLMALWTWRQFLSSRSIPAAWLSAIVAGVAVGLALLSKLSGMLALMVMASWVGLAWGVRRSWARGNVINVTRSTTPLMNGGLKEVGSGFGRWQRRASALDYFPFFKGGASQPGRDADSGERTRSPKSGFSFAMLMAAIISGLVFIALDPYMTALPRRAINSRMVEIRRMGLVERAKRMADLRLEMAQGQKLAFPHNALYSAYDKVSTTFVQGFGRFGPMGPRVNDSRIRYDFRQDRGALLWLPWVIASAMWAAWFGWEQARRGHPPVSWAILDYFLVALTVVMAYVPMAWDRYFLSLQAPSALLGAGFAVALAREVRQRVFRQAGA